MGATYEYYARCETWTECIQTANTKTYKTQSKAIWNTYVNQGGQKCDTTTQHERSIA